MGDNASVTGATRRGYDAAGRRAAADRNRRAVIDAASELLERDGYQVTTIRAVAQAAGVSVETIYKTFGTKPRLMKAVYDVAVAGDDAPVSVGDRPAIRAIWVIADAHEKVRAYAEFVAALMARLGGLLAVLTAADPELAEVRASTDDERLTGVTAFVRHLADQRRLRPGLAPGQAADAVWVLTSPVTYAQLTSVRGWTAAAYETWLARMLAATLLAD